MKFGYRFSAGSGDGLLWVVRSAEWVLKNPFPIFDRDGERVTRLKMQIAARRES